MIIFKNTGFNFDNKTILSDLNLHILPGEKAVLHGPSGKGKSTLLHAIMGFVHPDQGEIIINQAPLTTKSKALVRKPITWLPQEFTLPFEQVEGGILSPFQFKANQANNPNTATILNHFEQLGLEPEVLHKPLHQLSGAQRQRVMLVTAVLLRKPILLFDEPTSASDHDSIPRVITSLKAQTELIRVAVSHVATLIQAVERATTL